MQIHIFYKLKKKVSPHRHLLVHILYVFVYFVTYHRNFENYKLQISNCKLLSITIFYLDCNDQFASF